MAKLRHIALSVPDPEAAARFYCEAFGLKRLRASRSALADGVFLSDGVINVALLRFHDDEFAGLEPGTDERGKDWFGLHHIGFWVDDMDATEKKIADAGGRYLMGRPEAGAAKTFYEMKFRDPNGVMLDITHTGWGGAVKEVVPADEPASRKAQEKLTAAVGAGR